MLTKTLAWSEAVNAAIEDMVHGVPPFPYVRESLVALNEQADAIVVSATPCEALQREWEEHDIAQRAAVICGQEQGKKDEHLRVAAGTRYPKDHVLMIGDAPGDFKAARANDFLFYPINPGSEEESWRRFHDEALPKFFGGTYAGDYEKELITEFDAILPETPPWKR